jgi:acyl carrier protein
MLNELGILRRSWRDVKTTCFHTLAPNLEFIMDPTAARLRACFSRVFPDLTEEETLNARVGGTPEWDSLATVTLFSLIEEEFGVSLDLDEFDETMSFPGLLKRIEDGGEGVHSH